jgi:hypothetical protein
MDVDGVQLSSQTLLIGAVVGLVVGAVVRAVLQITSFHVVPAQHK